MISIVHQLIYKFRIKYYVLFRHKSVNSGNCFWNFLSCLEFYKHVAGARGLFLYRFLDIGEDSFVEGGDEPVVLLRNRLEKDRERPQGFGQWTLLKTAYNCLRLSHN